MMRLPTSCTAFAGTRAPSLVPHTPTLGHCSLPVPRLQHSCRALLASKGSIGGSSKSFGYCVRQRRGSMALGTSTSSVSAPTSSDAPNPAAIQQEQAGEDLDAMALRVVQLEKAAADMHHEAQRLNKEGRFAEAQAAYARMHSLEDEASALAKKVGCVQCVLGTPAPSEGASAAQQSICTIDSEILDQYREVYRPTPWSQAANAANVADAATLALAAAGTTHGGHAGAAKAASPPAAPSAAEGAAAKPGGGGVAHHARGVMRRAMGAVVGGAVADAAATGVHWIYDLQLLADLERDRLAPFAAGDRGEEAAEKLASPPGAAGPASLPAGVEFLDPPRSPFYSYPVGTNSPYGEQTSVLLHSLADSGGLDCGHYAERFAEYFGTGFTGYRDVSTKGFLRNHERGLVPPLTGADDAQANCTARMAPLVALFSGDPQLLQRVEMATRVTQNTDAACAWGCAGAAILEGIVLGRGTPSQVVAAVVADLEADSAAAAAAGGSASHQAGGQAGQDGAASGGGGEGGGGGVGSRFGGLWGMAGEVAAQLRRALEMGGLHPQEAIEQLGRNCHMPNALTSPLQVVLYVEHQLNQAGLTPEALTPPTPTQVPPSTPAPQHSASEWFQYGVRLAIREGGCCASRGAVAGACLGAWLGGVEAVPEQWLGRCTFKGKLEAALPLLCRSRGAEWP